MRWKALKYFGKLDNSGKENYGFKTRKCLPCVDELVDFEDDMVKMIKKQWIQKNKIYLQKKLSQTLKR